MTLKKIHGISTELAINEGVSISAVLHEFNIALSKAQFVVGQKCWFLISISWGQNFYRKDVNNILQELPVLDTCTEKTAELCKNSRRKRGEV